jgi:LPS-assembly protein
VVLQTGDDNYRLIDGTMTNCRFPKPDWQIISRAIKLEDGTASTSNSFFKLLGIPVFYLPTFVIRWTRPAARADC